MYNLQSNYGASVNNNHSKSISYVNKISMEIASSYYFNYSAISNWKITNSLGIPLVFTTYNPRYVQYIYNIPQVMRRLDNWELHGCVLLFQSSSKWSDSTL